MTNREHYSEQIIDICAKWVCKIIQTGDKVNDRK